MEPPELTSSRDRFIQENEGGKRLQMGNDIIVELIEGDRSEGPSGPEGGQDPLRDMDRQMEWNPEGCRPWGSEVLGVEQ